MPANHIGGYRRSRAKCRTLRARLRDRTRRNFRDGLLERVHNPSHRQRIKAIRLARKQEQANG